MIDFERCSLCQAHHEPGLRALLSFAYHVPVPVDELLSRLKEIEDLIRVPGLIGHSASARSLAMSIARQAPTEGVANLAVQLTAAVDALEEHELPLSASNIDLSKTLWRLRLALEREKKGD